MMKRLLLFLLATGVTAGYAQTPRQLQRGMITKITATWCGPCGSWGWNLANQMIADKGDKAFYVGVFSSSNGSNGNSLFYNPTAVAWSQQIGLSGYPSYGANAVDKSQQNTSGGGVNTAGVKTDVYAAIDAFATSPVIASTGYWFRKTGNTITAETKTEFWTATSGHYYIAAYLVEDGAMNKQNGQGSAPVAHHDVLRASMSPGTNYFGEELVNGAVTAGQTFDQSFSFTVTDNSWDMAKLKVITIVWKKNSLGKYEYVNGNDNFEFPASVAEVSGMTNLAVYPNPATGYTDLSVQLEQPTAVSIRLTDMSGRVVRAENARFNAGMNAWRLETSDLSAGMYVLSVASDKGTLTERVSVVR